VLSGKEALFLRRQNRPPTATSPPHSL